MKIIEIEVFSVDPINYNYDNYIIISNWNLEKYRNEFFIHMIVSVPYYAYHKCSIYSSLN